MDRLPDDWDSRLRSIENQLSEMIALSDLHGDFLLGALLCDAREHVLRRCDETSTG